MKKLLFILLVIILAFVSCEPNYAQTTKAVTLQNVITQNNENPAQRDNQRLLQRETHKKVWVFFNKTVSFQAQSLLDIKTVQAIQPQVKSIINTTGTCTAIPTLSTGGRTRTIAFSFNNIFAGSVSGGIFRYMPLWKQWLPVNDKMTNLAITSIVVEPANNYIMYAGTGEGFGNTTLQGAGIFKSTDGGVNWYQLASTANSNFYWVSRLAVHPYITGTVFACAGNRVYRTTDGGNTWAISLNGVSGNAVDIKINPSSPNIIVVGSFFDAYLSQDGGSSWVLQSTGLVGKLPKGSSQGIMGRPEFSFCAKYPNYIYVSIGKSYGELWVSRNFGTTWSCKNSTSKLLSDQSWYNNALWVNPQDTNIIAVGGVSLFRSTNAGATFTKVSFPSNAYRTDEAYSPHADIHCIVSSPTNNKKIYIGCDGGLSMTNDITTVTPCCNNAPSGWTNLNLGYNTLQCYAGAVSNDESVISAGYQDNGTSVTVTINGITTSREWLTGDGGFCAINSKNTLEWFGSIYYLNILKTTNGGKQFFSAINGLSDANNTSNTLFIAPFVTNPLNFNTVYAGGSSAWKTYNGAIRWFNIRNKVNGYRCISAITVSKKDTNTIYIGYESGIISKSTDGGVTWVNINSNLPKNYVTSIEIHPMQINTIIITLGGYNLTHIYKSTDGGSTWSNINNNLSAVHINKVRFSPIPFMNKIYLGTDAGLYVSTNGGTTWTLDTGFPNVEIDDIQFSGKSVFVFTYGRGIFKQRL